MEFSRKFDLENPTNLNDFLLDFQLRVDKDGHSYFATLEIKNVTVEDAGKYKVTAKNELGESNATISLNFDSKSICFYFIYFFFVVVVVPKAYFTQN